jgi:hypothetical protein
MAGRGGRRPYRVGDAAWPPNSDPDGDEQSVARPAGRCFPGLTVPFADVLGTKVGRLVAAEFADARRRTALGVARFVRFAANREAQVARQVLADDLVLLAVRGTDGSDT